MFRRNYSISPRELRLSTSAGTHAAGSQVPAAAWQPGNFPALLRML
jgi:hypothetical protein